MMSMETFLMLLIGVSVFTALVTEAIKKMMDEYGKTYKSNILAGTVSVVLSVLAGTGYIIMTETQINAKMAVILIALVLLSWLCAMVGYDKVMQAITQIKVSKTKEE
ncbi:MAG: aminopeptidase [Eubacteriales bacterium]|nr:aminopeptidase [Eubacteriales bacterium]